MTKEKEKTIQSIVMDGQLEKAEALAALSAASVAATTALPDLLIKCETQEQMQKVIADRDTCLLAYSNCFVRTLQHNGPLFEQIAKDLDKSAAQIHKKSKELKDAAEAVNLLSEAVRLATTLALAFA